MSQTRVVLVVRQELPLEHWLCQWKNAFPDFSCVRLDRNPASADPLMAPWQWPPATDSSAIVMVAHSSACLPAVRWAALHPNLVAGALFVAPVNATVPCTHDPFAPASIGSRRLPFRSITVASTDDDLVPVERGQQLARAWGSDHVLLGKRGHIDERSGLGLWQQGLDLLEELREAVRRSASASQTVPHRTPTPR